MFPVFYFERFGNSYLMVVRIVVYCVSKESRVLTYFAGVVLIGRLVILIFV